jgi:hypothetical protein
VGSGHSPVKIAFHPLAVVIWIQCEAIVLSRTGDTMYTVQVLWEGKAVTHTAWRKGQALEWLYAYPKKDVFAKVTDIFGRVIAVRYYR